MTEDTLTVDAIKDSELTISLISMIQSVHLSTGCAVHITDLDSIKIRNLPSEPDTDDEPLSCVKVDNVMYCVSQENALKISHFLKLPIDNL